MSAFYEPLPLLRPGDGVAVIAPAGLPDPEALRQGLALLGERYHVLTCRDLVADPCGAFAGTDEVRARELRWALGEPGVRCVIAARGGYGTARLLDGEVRELLGRSRQLLVGFSDLTVLLAAFLVAAGRRAVHGPMVCQLGRRGKAALEPLIGLLEGTEAPPPLERLACLHPGRARGALIGGNLTVLTHLVGTWAMPSLQGAVLLIEDVGERPYRLDRCLRQLLQAGALEGLAGLAVGDLTDCEPQGGEHSVAEVLAHLGEALRVPVVVGLPAGHGPVNRPLPLGAQVELDADAGRLVFSEGAVR